MMFIKRTLHLSTVLLIFDRSSTVARICLIIFLLIGSTARRCCNNLVHMTMSDLTSDVEGNGRRCTRWTTSQRVSTLFLIFRIKAGYQCRVVTETPLVAVSNTRYVLIWRTFKLLLFLSSWGRCPNRGCYLLITVQVTFWYACKWWIIATKYILSCHLPKITHFLFTIIENRIIVNCFSVLFIRIKPSKNNLFCSQ